jgi:hypothetical protein
MVVLGEGAGANIGTNWTRDGSGFQWISLVSTFKKADEYKK